MEGVLLFSLQREDINVTIEAYFDQDGNLVVDGYDMGKTVASYWGDSDYEYATTVSPGEVAKLYTFFALPVGSQSALLLALQARFHTNTCYSEFQQFLDENQIRYVGFSWT